MLYHINSTHIIFKADCNIEISKIFINYLYLYKKQYAGEFVEMPGEYHLVLDEKKYNFFHKKLNYFRRIVFRKK